jgi:hypothetical protein
MDGKFVEGFAILCNSYPIGIGQTPTVIVYPFHETVTHARLPLHGKLSAVLIKDFVTGVND